MVKVLYICDVDICRSPAALIITEKLMQEKGILEDQLKIDSAGLYARPGQKIIRSMREALSEFGYTDDKYKSKQATRELLLGQDYIICMDRNQVKSVLEIAPEKEGRVYTLTGFVGYGHSKIPHPDNSIKPMEGRSILENIVAACERYIFNLFKLDKFQEADCRFYDEYFSGFPIWALIKRRLENRTRDITYLVGSMTCGFLGYTYKRNIGMINRLNRKTARRIEFFVAQLLNKLSREGKI